MAQRTINLALYGRRINSANRANIVCLSSSLSPPTHGHFQVTKKVVFERVNFESDPEFVVSEQEITVVDGLTTANIQVNVKKTLPKDHLLFLELSSEKEGEFKSLIKTGEVVGCDLLKNATGQPLLKPVLSLLEKFSNLPLQCPLPVVSQSIGE